MPRDEQISSLVLLVLGLTVTVLVLPLFARFLGSAARDIGRMRFRLLKAFGVTSVVCLLAAVASIYPKMGLVAAAPFLVLSLLWGASCILGRPDGAPTTDENPANGDEDVSRPIR